MTNFAYMRYDMISADIRKVVDKWENGMLETVRGGRRSVVALAKARGSSSRRSARRRRSSCSTDGLSWTNTCW
ncbi:MAG: hypothetical protein ACLRMJ_01595 [Alistipes finegoldii]